MLNFKAECCLFVMWQNARAAIYVVFFQYQMLCVLKAEEAFLLLSYPLH